jgi:hypothetical protein
MTINEPEYFLRDEMATIVAAVKVALGLPNLHFEFDAIEKVNATLQAWSKQEVDRVKKFPLVWLPHPYTIHRGLPDRPDLFGELQNGMLIIANASKVDIKGAERDTNNFKTIIYPIYREILKQLYLSTVFETGSIEQIEHNFTDRFYWGEDQKQVFDDVVDCSIVSDLKLKIYNNYNCVSFKNF